jgi:hypothetical protein
MARKPFTREKRKKKKKKKEKKPDLAQTRQPLAYAT